MEHKKKQKKQDKSDKRIKHDGYEKKELTMLIVDDSLFNWKILSSLFEEEYNTIWARDGVEALRILKEKRGTIDIVLLDLVMPKMDGFETLERRKNLDYFKDIPVIFITSSEGNDEQIRAFELGASDFVVKPFTPEVVTLRVNNVMNSRRRQLSLEKEAQSMKDLSQLDQMTGLYNKVTGESIMKEILHKQESKQHALIIIDIDNFKAVNDTQGHLMGDHTIHVIADLISGQFRTADIVSRIGGDEFMVLMTDIPNMDVTREKVKNLVQLVRDTKNLTIPDNISISVGYVNVDIYNEHTFDELFVKADAALYQAKKSGKNQAREFGNNQEIIDILDRKNIVLITKSRSVCGSIYAFMSPYCNVIDVSSVADLAQVDPKHQENTIMVFADTMGSIEENVEFWKQLDEQEWVKKLPIVAMYEEGNLNQCRIALERDVLDVMTLPLEPLSFKRRLEQYLKNKLDTVEEE